MFAITKYGTLKIPNSESWQATIGQTLETGLQPVLSTFRRIHANSKNNSDKDRKLLLSSRM